MTFRDDINRILRDHEGGDPSTWPVGDRSTARKPLDKKDLRYLFGIFDDSATAAQGIIAAAADTITSFPDVSELLKSTVAIRPGSVIGTRADGTSFVVASPNLMSGSEILGAWERIQCNVTETTGIAPDGSLTAARVVPVAGTVNAGINREFAGLVAGRVAASVYAKASGRDCVQIRWFGGDAGITSAYANYNLTTGQSKGNAAKIWMENVGSGWWRLCAEAIITGNLQSQDVGLEFIDNIDQGRRPLGIFNGTSGTWFWGAQVQQGTVSAYQRTGVRPTASAGVTAGGQRLVRTDLENLRVTVGAGGAFPTVNAALEHLSGRRRGYRAEGVMAEIYLLPGFTMAEQVLVSGGVDLGWITITSADAQVPVDASAITVALSVPDSLTPIFGARDGSVLPVIGVKFAFPVNTHGKDGVAVILGSEVRFLPGGAGVVRARNGLKVLYGSKASCYIQGLVIGGDGTGAGTTRGVDFSYAASRALHVAHGSQAFLARGDFRYAGGDMAVYVIWKSHADLYQSTAANAAGTAYLVRDDSTANCRETEAANAGGNGYHAVHLGRINARSRPIGQIQWVGQGAKNCKGYAVLANDNSYIAADSLDCDLCTGSAAVLASQGSNVTFTSGRATNASLRGIWADAGEVSAAGAVCTGSLVNGAVCENGGTITGAGINVSGAADKGLLAVSGGRIVAPGAIADNCATAVEVRDGAINVRGASVKNATVRALSVIDGGELHCMDAITTGATAFHLTVRGGGIVKAANYSGAIDLRDGGGIVFNYGGTGSTSQTVNTQTSSGVIYR